MIVIIVVSFIYLIYLVSLTSHIIQPWQSVFDRAAEEGEARTISGHIRTTVEKSTGHTQRKAAIQLLSAGARNQGNEHHSASSRWWQTEEAYWWYSCVC